MSLLVRRTTIPLPITVVLVGLMVRCAGADGRQAAEPPPLPPAAKQTVDFARDIQPLLINHCRDCHGPDLQESQLRLDRRASLLRGGDSGEPAIVPRKSAESYLIGLVSGRDPERVMPPDGERLTAAQIGLLRAWIDQGANWPGQMDADHDGLETDFWSFQPLKPVPPPPMDDARDGNPVDAFVLRKLRDAGLEPSPPADRRTLIRRLYFDMLGLPPTPAEIEEFVADERGDAWKRLVDRVLASEHYGERWARHWLDVVRFAETDGFEMNQNRPNAWHYRDYVIRALNDDKPYDRFVFEQLAGDTVGADVATGFLVGGAYDKVKSPDIALTLMQRQDELADMINTTGTAFLGLTLGCAKCHNHKFDPILQKDFYAIQAVFAGVRHGERPLETEDDERRKRQLREVDDRIAAIREELARHGLREPVDPRKNEERFEPVTAKFVRFTISATNTGTQPCLDELEVYAATDAKGEARNVALASAGAKATASGTLPGFAIHKLEHVNDGRHGNERSWISNEAGKGWVTIELPEPLKIDRVVWGRDRNGKYTDRLPTEYVIEAADEPDEWKLVASSADRLAIGSDLEAIEPEKLQGRDIEIVRGLLAEAKALGEKRERLSKPTQMVYAGKFEQPKPTHRLYRGDPMSPREVVAPGGLSVLDPPQLQVDSPERKRRVVLAQWIASAENPLTPRVIVNRLWHYHFGTGIVDTPSDFGRNGGRPTHPELLDWLAGELIAADWSLKHVHRLILMSETYRQASSPRPDALKVDGDSRLLWRYPPRRMEAEVIRDAMLAVSGVLETRMGGPGFSVFEPNSNYVRVYEPKRTFGPAEWRRSIYMFKVRMEQDAVFGAFDCPDAGQVAPKRSRSTTAIQALNLFNSGFTTQQAELFAARVERETGADRGRQIRRVFELAFGREPGTQELEAAKRLVDRHGLPALCRAVFNANEFLFIP